MKQCLKATTMATAEAMAYRAALALKQSGGISTRAVLLPLQILRTSHQCGFLHLDDHPAGSQIATGVLQNKSWFTKQVVVHMLGSYAAYLSSCFSTVQE
jgi:hypothetical protein